MILGHQRQIEYLQKVLERGMLAHAYLFYGPEHVGKFTIAKALAKIFYCEFYRSLASIANICNECRECRLVEANLHPYITILDAEEASISIDDIRELKKKFSFRAIGNQQRAVIINRAEKMTLEAANAFLKLLEEPGEKAIFLLVSASRELLPATIVSRTQPLWFSLVSEKILDQFLKTKILDETIKKEILRYAAARPGIMLKLLLQKEYLLEERKFSHALDAALDGSLPQTLQLAAVNWREDYFPLRLADGIIEKLRHKAIKQAIASGSARPYISRLKEAHRILLLLETTNINLRLALDALLLNSLSSLTEPKP